MITRDRSPRCHSWDMASAMRNRTPRVRWNLSSAGQTVEQLWTDPVRQLHPAPVVRFADRGAEVGRMLAVHLAEGPNHSVADPRLIRRNRVEQPPPHDLERFVRPRRAATGRPCAAPRSWVAPTPPDPGHHPPRCRRSESIRARARAYCRWQPRSLRVELEPFAWGCDGCRSRIPMPRCSYLANTCAQSVRRGPAVAALSSTRSSTYVDAGTLVPVGWHRARRSERTQARCSR